MRISRARVRFVAALFISSIATNTWAAGPCDFSKILQSLRENAEPPSSAWGTRETIESLSYFGASLAERREVMNPPMEVAAVARQLREQPDDTLVFLRELRSDVLWARQALVEIEGEGVAALTAEGASSSSIQIYRERVNDLRDFLAGLSLDGRGINLAHWNAAGMLFVELASAGRTGKKFLFDSLRRGRPFHEVINAFHLQSMEHPGRRVPHYRPVFTARHLRIRDVNEWMSRGIAPIAVTRRSIAHDGETARTQPMATSPRGFNQHDRNHWKDYGTRDTGLSIGPEEYYDVFQTWMRSERFTAEQIDVLEALWFIVYHESTLPPYGPASIARHIGQAKVEFSGRMRPGDIGDTFASNPSQDTVYGLADRLLRFSHQVRKDYAR
jgi:hypothetical protein